jgi:transposase
MPATSRPRRSSAAKSDAHLGKPRGILSPRVRAVGPDHFGIVAVDCAKARSKWMFTDFYGRVLIPPTVLEHRRNGFGQAITRLRQAIASQHIHDLVVAVERTGRYHLPPLRNFANAGFDTRVVHPSIARHFRQAGAFDTKTDDTDLEGIFRAAINGFGLGETPWDSLFTALQLWARHRRDLVQKSSQLRCQVLEHLQAYLPGYAARFDNPFETAIALLIPRHYANPQAIVEAGLPGLTALARREGVRVQTRTLNRILGWARDAPRPDSDAALRQRLVVALDDDRLAKGKQVQAVECDLVSHLVQTPYVRLLALAGVNVTLASEFAGEAGPIEHYANARVITGRAGLFPRRYQSDQVDYASGSLARRGNRRLRQVLLLTAGTLIRCNDHFEVLGAKWNDQGKDPRDIHVRVAGRFARIAFQMVSGTVEFRHPACQGPPVVLSKLLAFHEKHGIDPETTRINLGRAAASLPAAEEARERTAMHDQWEQARDRRGRGPRRLSEILPAVLELMGGCETTNRIESQPSGETP